MKLFKTIPILLFALLFVFAGCGKTNTNTDTGNLTNQEAAAPTNPSQENVSQEIIPESENTQTSENQNAEEVSYITAAEAEAAALKHAGVTADEVKDLRSEFDYDNGVAEYDVDFYYDGYEYDYDVNAVTGEITWHEKEPEKDKTATDTNTTDTTANDKTDNARNGTTNTSKLTKAEAEAIALKHAGYTADEVKGLRSEYDRDNGVYEYDIEFRAGGYEFDYEINAETGKIISYDKEWDD